MEGLMMLHGHREWLEGASKKTQKGIVPEVFLGDAECLQRITDALPGQDLRFRVFTGYAGWGPGQLEKELSGGDWAVVPASSQLLFDTPADELWERLVPPRIPEPSVN
jgi:putative AlgH/UPF0301 family transcriptional regulator